MAKPRTAKQVLQASIDLFENVGWTRGEMQAWDEEYNDETGEYTTKVVGYCAVGAIEQVDGPAQRAAELRLAKYLVSPAIPEAFWDEAWPSQGRAGKTLQQLAKEAPQDIIITFNDAGVNRTKEEVIAAFKGAIGE